ncbi:ABC transporter transmembrane domain-containing protein [Gilvimarinus sp. F26214L]|uniref:ABC transporter transmembrane domain-containing protein n=1 Tax=Gilvimarinus sp. DZF01 TaxID=3461371 RepID=UPI004045B2A1
MTPSSAGKLAVLSQLLHFVRPYRLQTLGAAVALVFTALVTLSLGQGVRFLIDRGFIAESQSALNQSVALIVALIIFMAVGTFLRFYAVSWLGERVSADLRKAVFNHVIRLHPSYFETNRSGEITSRLTTDTSLLQNIIGSSASMALRSALLLIGGLIMLLATNLKLSLIVIASVPIVLLPILFFGRRVRRLARASQDSIAHVGSQAGEIIQHIKTVQSYTREAMEQDSFARDVEQAFQVARRRIRQRSFLIAAVILLVFSAIAGMLWVGGSDVLEGRMSPGELGAFVFYAVVVAMAVATISEVFGELQRAAGATERLLELLAADSLIQAPDQPAPVQPTNAAIQLDGVRFCYPSRPGIAALEDVSLTVDEGRSLALVGPSGAGKSTVFELLERFYDPEQGVISIGGLDIRQLSPQTLREQIALVPQQPALFTGDVNYNIRYGNPGARDEEVVAAAKAAHAHEFIMALPDGYRSALGEQGVRLSGGQRQRIAIARAILKNPRILLLDEATSALDSESERHVQEAIERLMENRTTLIIAHRLSTVQHADQIAVLEKGRVVAVGTHRELLSNSELYQRLHSLQFQDQRAGELSGTG